jgi:hypothetical protein
MVFYKKATVYRKTLKLMLQIKFCDILHFFRFTLAFIVTSNNVSGVISYVTDTIFKQSLLYSYYSTIQTNKLIFSSLCRFVISENCFINFQSGMT